MREKVYIVSVSFGVNTLSIENPTSEIWISWAIVS